MINDYLKQSILFKIEHFFFAQNIRRGLCSCNILHCQYPAVYGTPFVMKSSPLLEKHFPGKKHCENTIPVRQKSRKIYAELANNALLTSTTTSECQR